MKRVITLLAVMAFALAGSLQAQESSSQLWWGYMGNTTNLTSVGVSKADTYHCALFLPGDHEVAGGKKLCGVRFGLTAQHASNVKVWIAPSLPGNTFTERNTLWMHDLAEDELGADIEVLLDQPVDIPAKGAYVGYSFTITSASTTDDNYPVITAGSDMPNGLFIRTNSTMPQWTDLYGNGFGVLALKVLLEGAFPQNSVSPSLPQASCYAQLGQTADFDVTLTNYGAADVTSVAYTISGGQEQTVTLSSPIGSYSSGRITVSVPAEQTAGSTTKKLTITKVNGAANESTNAAVDFTLYSMDRVIARNVVVEEFTGTGCGWCPRGLVGMEKLRNTFGERFIGIGIHQYNSSDAMYISNYPNLGFTGAPSCTVDRVAIVDPYYGSADDICDDFRAEMNQPAMVGVSVSGEYNEAETEVLVKASVEPLFDTSDYHVEMVLVADGLTGTTSAWWQSNYYASQSPSSEPEDLRVFCSGGKMGQSSVKNYVFNDVAIASSFVGGVNRVEALGSLTGGESRQVSYTLAMPTKATLRNAIRNGVVYAVALVVGSDGRIANAAKAKVGETTAVSGVQTQVVGTATTTSLSGTRLQLPRHGVNIVRQADGSVRKVIVK